MAFGVFADHVEDALGSVLDGSASARTGSSPPAEYFRPVLAVASDAEYGRPIDKKMIMCRRVPIQVVSMTADTAHIVVQSAGVQSREFKFRPEYMRLLEASDGTSSCEQILQSDADWRRMRKLLAHDLVSLVGRDSPPPVVPAIVRSADSQDQAIIRPVAVSGDASVSRCFRDTGCLADHLDRVTIEDELAAQLEAAIGRILEWRPDVAAERQKKHVSSWQQVNGDLRPRRINALWAIGEEFQSLLASSALNVLCEKLAPGVQLCYLAQQMLVKWPGPESELSWHRDPGAPLGTNPDTDFVVGIHFSEPDSEDSIQLVAGSHHWTAEQCERYLSALPGEISPVTMAVRPRSVTAHSRSALHRSRRPPV